MFRRIEDPHARPGAPTHWEFTHQHFIRDRPELQTMISRKTNGDLQTRAEVNVLKDEVNHLQMTVSSMYGRMEELTHVLMTLVQERPDLHPKIAQIVQKTREERRQQAAAAQHAIVAQRAAATATTTMEGGSKKRKTRHSTGTPEQLSARMAQMQIPTPMRSPHGAVPAALPALPLAGGPAPVVGGGRAGRAAAARATDRSSPGVKIEIVRDDSFGSAGRPPPPPSLPAPTGGALQRSTTLTGMLDDADLRALAGTATAPFTPPRTPPHPAPGGPPSLSLGQGSSQNVPGLDRFSSVGSLSLADLEFAADSLGKSRMDRGLSLGSAGDALSFGDMDLSMGFPGGQ
jgi:hypothetical protein